MVSLCCFIRGQDVSVRDQTCQFAPKHFHLEIVILSEQTFQFEPRHFMWFPGACSMWGWTFQFEMLNFNSSLHISQGFLVHFQYWNRHFNSKLAISIRAQTFQRVSLCLAKVGLEISIRAQTFQFESRHLNSSLNLSIGFLAPVQYGPWLAIRDQKFPFEPTHFNGFACARLM